MEMKFKVEPYEWQHKAIRMSDEDTELALLAEMGCISGDAEVRINRGGNSKRYKLRDAFKKFHESWDQAIPTKIRGYKNGIIGLVEVYDIIYSGVKKVYKVTLANGMTIKATDDHEFLTTAGWVPLNKLGSNSVMVDTTTRYKKKAVRKKKKVKPRYALNQVGLYHPYSQKATIHNRPVRRVERHRLVYEASLNRMTLEEFKAATHRPNRLNFIDPSVYHIHHKDHNSKNDVLENLECLLKEDHLRKHGNNKHFGHGEPEYSEVVGIRFAGTEDTYDLKCEHPYHNFVADGMVVHNCGKTGALINILRRRYMEKRRLMKTLILSPLVTLFNWKEEFDIHSYIDQRDIMVLHKGAGKKKAMDFCDFVGDKVDGSLRMPKIVILNYEALINENLYKVIQEWKPEILVCDESHLCKTYNSKRTKKVTALADRSLYRYLMTGTPILNSVQDIYAQYRILDGGRSFGKNFFVFRSNYMEDENAGWSNKPGHFPKFVARSETYGELHQKVYKKAIRVLKSECLDLPPLVKQKRMIELSKDQRKYYEEMKRDFVTFVNEKQQSGSLSGAVVAQLAVTKALRLQQIAAGFVTTDDGEEIYIKNNPRLEETKNLLEELTPNHKVILWCSFRANYKQLGDLCKQLKLNHVFITGEQKLTEKQAAMKEFNNDPTCKVCIANRRAGGIGINLVASDYSIVYSRNFSLGDELQSEARNHRGGSQIHDRITKIDLVARDTIDEHVIQALQNKENLSKRIVDLAKEL